MVQSELYHISVYAMLQFSLNNSYNSMHFSDGADVSPEYSYDVNGNLIKDLNRKISLIQYNILNLPKKISFSNGAFEEMTYIMGSNRMVLS
jgi:hypothetical protein